MVSKGGRLGLNPHTSICKIETRQGPPVEHRERHSGLCVNNSLHGKRMKQHGCVRALGN